MKKLIATMIISVIMGQPVLAGPLSMAQWRLTGDPKLLGRFQYADTKYVGAPTMQKAKSPWVKLGYAGALAFSLLSWQQLGQASDNEAEAKLNREHGQEARAQKLDDKADRARLFGWSAAVLAAGSLGVALISRKTTHPVFPELNFRDGEPHVGVSYVYSF